MGVRGELGAFLRDLEIAETRRVGPALLHCGKLHGRTVVAGEIAIGKVNAAAGTQTLIDAFHPSHLLFSGSAGSLSADLHVGDVVIADAVAVHDSGAYHGESFTPGGYMLLAANGRRCSARRISPPAVLLDLARRTAAQVQWPGENGEARPSVRVHTGTIVTGDQVVLSERKKRWLQETFGAVAVEMEGSAFAQVATQNDVPWLLVRSVSDQADHQADFAFELWQEYVDDDHAVHARLSRTLNRFNYVLSTPGALRKAKRIVRDIRYAAANAARLVEAMVAVV